MYRDTDKPNSTRTYVGILLFFIAAVVGIVYFNIIGHVEQAIHLLAWLLVMTILFTQDALSNKTSRDAGMFFLTMSLAVSVLTPISLGICLFSQ